MFSYRHAFHAGNHADVLKHLTLIAVLKHLMQKDSALTLVDSHAGAGLYRLDGDYSSKGGEAADGVIKLFAALAPANTGEAAIKDIVPSVQDYLDMVAGFNPGGRLKVYPGSPFVMQSLLRDSARDRLKLFELHPTDHKALAGNIAQLDAARQIAVARADGFEGLKAFVPPPVTAGGSRRALVLIDPSYEIKSDYGKVSHCIADCLKRFSTGCYLVWYPVIPRPEAHELPRRLKTLANQAGKPWLHATLNIGQPPDMKTVVLPGERAPRPGLTASGMFVLNPPHTLKATLQAALPQLLTVLERGAGKGWQVEAGG